MHDNWWQTETGAIMIANQPAMAVHPGSMGRPLPGVEATVLRHDADGNLVLDTDRRPVECAADETGELALRAGWPSMFRGYLGQPERYARCFTDGWYRSGDLVRWPSAGSRPRRGRRPTGRNASASTRPTTPTHGMTVLTNGTNGPMAPAPAGGPSTWR